MSMTLDRRNAAFSHEEFPIILLFLVFSVAALAYVYGFGLPFGAPPIRSDGFGYNAYLPAFFLDHDLTFRTMITRLSASTDPLASNGEINMWSGIVPYKDTGLYIDIYPIGERSPTNAVLPRCRPHWKGVRADEICSHHNVFHRSFKLRMSASSTAYFLIGTLCHIQNLCDHCTTDKQCGSIILMTCGTSLFHYATLDGSFAHVYSFALVALWFRCLFQYLQRPPERARQPRSELY